jgi:hypothetical protein
MLTMGADLVPHIRLDGELERSSREDLNLKS